MSKDRPILEGALTAGEAIADTLKTGAFWEEVPVIGVAFKLLKAKDTIQDRMFAAKLARFASSVELNSSTIATQWAKRIETDIQEARGVGETLLLTIDRLASLDKSALIGIVFADYLNGNTNALTLRYLAQSIDAAFVDDLKALLESTERQSLGQHVANRLEVAGLASSTLTAMGGGEYSHVARGFNYSELGLKLRDICKRSNRQQS